MPRIFYVIDSFAVGGAQTQLLQLLQKIDKDKFAMAVCPVWPLPDLDPAFEATGAEIVRVHKKFPLDLSEAFRLGAAIRKFKPDIVHTWLFTGSLWGRLAAWLARSPIVITSERSFVTENYYSPFLDIIKKAFVPFTDAITVNSTFGGRFLIEKGIPSQKIHTIFNGVDIHSFSPDVAAYCRDSMRNEFDIPDEALAIGMVGRLVPPKNQEILILAVDRLVRYGYNVHLILVGEGPERQKLVMVAHDLGIEERIHFTGQRKDIPEILSSFDIFALSSRWEGMPNVVLEAMASGLPVVATDVSGIGDLVQDGVTGFRVAVDDLEKTVESLKKLLDFPSLRRSMGQNARLRCEKEYNLETMVSRTVELYDTLLKSKGLNGL